jgi:hypothetical protein
MMGHRAELKSGDEYDALTGWRRVCGYKAGTVKAIKRKFNKRIRREAKGNLSSSQDAIWP